MSTTTEILAAACQKIEVEQKCVKRRKRRENVSIPDNNDDKDKSTNIVAKDRDKMIVADMEHHTVSNTSNPRHTIRHQINNAPLTPVKKIVTYWKR